MESMAFHIIQGLDINIAIPCHWRAEIYRVYLEDACRFFYRFADYQVTSLDFGNLPEDRRIDGALRDARLLSSLAQVLDTYVAIGVSRDLGKWRNRVFSGRAVEPPNDVGFLVNDPDRDGEPQGENQLRTWYQEYFERFINADPVTEQGFEATSGIHAFFRRYPLIEHAVKTCTKNFVENIRLACERVCEDAWPARGAGVIGSVFFEGVEPTCLARIVASGSDTHKGGKQVLFLTFTIRDRDEKLVYKPSDIEMDYRLIGDTTIIRKDAAYGLGHHNSLAELVNQHLISDGHTDYQLPTYRILPRNPGSELPEDENHSMPIRNSYGYITYLSHEPAPGNMAMQMGAPVGWVQGQVSDWVTENEQDVKKFFSIWGGFLAIAYLVSLSDLHQENVIVHNKQPYLIDLENAFCTKMSSLKGTGTQDALNKSSSLKAAWFDSRDNQTANFKFKNMRQDQRCNEASNNRIWLFSSPWYSNDPRIIRCQAGDYIDEIRKGYVWVMEVLVRYRVDIASWLANIENVIARFVPTPTRDYYAHLFLDEFGANGIYAACSHRAPNIAPGERYPDQTYFMNANDTDITAGWAFKRWVSNALRTFNNNENNIRDLPTPPPLYALETRKHNFRDLLNCDIPAYSHRLNSLELVNSLGEIVNIRDTDSFIITEDTARNPINGVHDPQRNSFFPPYLSIYPESGTVWEIVAGQLETLTAEKYNNLWREFADVLRSRSDAAYFGMVDFSNLRP